MQRISADGYQHRRHNKNLLMIHVIFVVKYRKQLLFGTIREDIMQYIFDICNRKHWYIRRMETDKDHIHILLQYNPTDNVSTDCEYAEILQYIPHLEKTQRLSQNTFLEREYFLVG